MELGDADTDQEMSNTDEITSIPTQSLAQRYAPPGTHYLAASQRMSYDML